MKKLICSILCLMIVKMSFSNDAKKLMNAITNSNITELQSNRSTQRLFRDSIDVFVTEETFEFVFMDEIVKYIATGDTSNLFHLINDDDMALLAIGEYYPSKNKQFFFNFIERHLDIKTENAIAVRNTNPVYTNYTFPDGEGGAFKFTVFYPNSDRYDDFIITFGGNAKMISIVLQKEVNNNPYFDGNIGKVVGGEFGLDGAEGKEYKID